MATQPTWKLEDAHRLIQLEDLGRSVRGWRLVE